MLKEWDEIELNEYSYVKGYPFKSEDYKKNGTRIIRVSDIGENNLKNNAPVFISTKLKNKYNKWALDINNIIITTVGSKPPMYESIVGKSLRINNDCIGMLLNQNNVLLKISDDDLSKLVYENLKSKRYFKYINEIYRGNANQASININELFKYKVLIPKSSEERHLIASLFCNVDNLIDSLQMLINKKEKIMNKTVDEKIKEYNQYSKKYSLSQICDHYGGTSLEEYVTSNGKYKFISIGNYLSNGKYYDNNQRINSTGKASNKILHKDDLVMVLNDKTQNGNIIGSTILIEADDKYIYNQRSERIVCNKDIIFPKYLWIYLNSSIKRKEIFDLSQGGTQIYVNFNKIYKTSISVPSKTEQEEFIHLVDNMDNEINLLNKKLSKYKKIKAGMLEDLLTGKVRLSYE